MFPHPRFSNVNYVFATWNESCKINLAFKNANDAINTEYSYTKILQV